MRSPTFIPPPYGFDLLEDLRTAAELHPGGAVDLSVGTPCDPVPDVVIEALKSIDADSMRPYPASAGDRSLLNAVCQWLGGRFSLSISPEAVGACVGTKELVVGMPQALRLRDPGRDTILFPEISYISYAMGAELAGCRAVPVPVDEAWRMDLSQIDESDAERSIAIWNNTPANPTGAIDDLGAIADWGRERGITVLSDECYAEFTWAGAARTILKDGLDGVLAVHSLSKRSNLAGLRVGFYAGDPDLVTYLRGLRRHQGLMISGFLQTIAVAVLSDQSHVSVQAEIYRRRLENLIHLLGMAGIEATFPDGGFYLWVRAPSGDAWELARFLAEVAGIVVCPGELFGTGGSHYVRIAAVGTDEKLGLVKERLDLL